jgi:hypothetical protein
MAFLVGFGVWGLGFGVLETVVTLKNAAQTYYPKG